MRRELLRAGAHCILGFLLLSLCGCAAINPHQTALDTLLTLIEQRLVLANDVARSKWNSGAAVEDLPRENEIVEAIGRDAGLHGLDAGFAKSFFRAQIEASKLAQNARLAQWRAARQPPFADAPDLQRDIRPRLDRLTPLMLDALSRSLPALHAPDAALRLQARAGDAAHAAALQPLLSAARGN
jgi:chorismate mutase